ncbi:MAG: cation:proton antiporter [Acidimicrobiales bacterium]
MITNPVTALAVILSVAVFCQWLGSRVKLPSVLFLLVAGVAMSAVLDPDAVFGDLLFTGVGLGVAILLFEGGTSLHWSELRVGRAAVIRLCTVGAVVTWAVATGAVAGLLPDVDTNLALLIGAILIVSGPTVVIPLLRAVRPRPPTGAILRWEGILIDPVGAGLAIVVLDAMVADRSVEGIALRILTTFGAGAAVGAVASVALVTLLRQRLIPDHLQVPATLAFVVAAYAAANSLRPEAGLLAVTMLGMALANQRKAPAAHIAEFNEHLGSVILGSLFVVLGARVDLEEVAETLLPSLAIIAVLVLVARPLTVIASTTNTGLNWREKAFMMVMCPRGVVAAAVASLFALELEHEGIDPGPLVPVVFTVVVGTVALVGLGARPAARRLRVAEPDPNGVAFVGGGHFALELADALNEQRISTLHVGLGDEDSLTAAYRGQLVYRGRLNSEEFPETVRAVGIGTAVALSGTDHLDTFASERIARVVGSANVYGLPTEDSSADPGTAHLVAPRALLPTFLDSATIDGLLDKGATMRTVMVGTEDARDDDWLTICRVKPSDKVVFDLNPSNAEPGDRLIQFGPGIAAVTPAAEPPLHSVGGSGEDGTGGDGAEHGATSPA